MKILISPAKSLNETPLDFEVEKTLPYFQKEAKTIINKLKKTSTKKIKELMNLSDDLAKLNKQRYLDYNDEYTVSKAALYLFNGDVYTGMNPNDFNEEERVLANDRIRILSGLYGILNPLDSIQAYRLEMGTKLKVGRKDNLVKFWKDKVSTLLNSEMVKSNDQYLINLASKEYFSAIDPKQIDVPIITIDFKEWRNDRYKVISFSAKKARGMMCHYIIKNNIKKLENLKGFDYEDYCFNEELSSKEHMIFTR